MKAVTVFVTAFIFCSAHAEAAVKTGQPAPAFKLFAINGQPVSNEALKGSITILDFWATWCPPCRESIPFFIELHRKYGKQGLQIIGMNVDETGERHLKSFATERNIPYPIVTAPRKLQDEYGVRALPVLFVLDKNGVVIHQMLGFSAPQGQALERLIKRLLSQ